MLFPESPDLFSGDSTINNESNETICSVYISPTTATSWGKDWINETAVIAPGEQQVFEVAANTYDILLGNCAGTPLREEHDVSITGDQVITLIQTDVCHAFNQIGQQLYSQSYFAGSLQFYEDALRCFQDRGTSHFDLVGEFMSPERAGQNEIPASLRVACPGASQQFVTH